MLYLAPTLLRSDPPTRYAPLTLCAKLLCLFQPPSCTALHPIAALPNYPLYQLLGYDEWREPKNSIILICICTLADVLHLDTYVFHLEKGNLEICNLSQ